MSTLLLSLHVLFFAPLLVRAAVQRRARGHPGVDSGVRGASSPSATPAARLALGVHGAGLVALYLGITVAMRGSPWPPAASATTIAGLAMLAAADLLVAWTAVVFASWRLRPDIAAGHELCTSGPFALMRHPIYAAVDLLALGTVLCLPTPAVISAGALLAVGGWLRARVEERALVEAFGDAYRSYQARVRGRFVPFL